MKISEMRLFGIRCFEDTGDVQFAMKINIFVGKNNAGKSSFIKGILGLQGFPFDVLDIRPSESASLAFSTLNIVEIQYSDKLNIGNYQSSIRIITPLRGELPHYYPPPSIQLGAGHPTFIQTRPHHTLVPFLAKRKAAQFKHDISLGAQSSVTGTLESLYGRIDLLATYGHPDHDNFREAVEHIVGLQITMKASDFGKEAGFYFDRNNFVNLERMGDGVSEMVALIVELCTERNKIFVLEEPETNLHPSALKALLALIRQSAEHNQFFITTHSNVVVRELGGLGEGRVFRVFRDGDKYTSPSKVDEVEKTPVAHMNLLGELGYEFTDFDLFEGWLFLEEASAESVFRDVLIPMFAGDLRGRLRTYSSGGSANLEPSVSEFHRLIVFIHLQPVYQDRLWVRADGDEAGVNAVSKLRVTFAQLSEDALSTFVQPNFELYYPKKFESAVEKALAEPDKKSKRQLKATLLQDVIAWSKENEAEARTAWKISAAEPIALLESIRSKLAMV